jgi:glucose/arabinose dehydrogenase
MKLRRAWSLAGRRILPVVALVAALIAVDGRAQIVRAAFPIQLETVATGLDLPIYLTSAHDGSHRLFIVEQAGLIKVLQPGASAPTVFLDIRDRVLPAEVKGLLGLAFHPQFASNRRFFVHYTREPDGAIVIAEYRASSADGNVADHAETVLLTIATPVGEHNGGTVEFGPDGYLYVSVGDGGGKNDPAHAAQDLDQLLGKILRIDVDRPDGSRPYSVPPTNPFVGASHARDEIFAYGFRNPYRFSFDRVTGELIVGDVGEDDREELDVVVAGGNYGWPIFEGTLCTGLLEEQCGQPGTIPPAVEYRHRSDFGDPAARCAIIGGYAYRGTRGTLPLGTYLFGDFCSGEIFQREGSEMTVLLWLQTYLASFGEDEAGELYVMDLFGGVLYRIVAAPTQMAAAVLPGSRSVQVGVPATAFATMIWAGPGTARGCGITPIMPPPGTFLFQATGGATNLLEGAPNEPVDIPSGGAQTFLIALTPTQPFDPVELALDFRCANAPSASVIPGVNTLLLSSSADPVPDVIAIAVTPTGDGILDIPGPDGTAAFSVATSNAGRPGRLTVSADTASAVLPIALSICRTDSVGGCLSPPAPTVSLEADTTATLSVFVQGRGIVPFDPAVNRVNLRFTDAGVVRGLTSVAVRTR